MKFDPPTALGRGFAIILRADDRTVVGIIHFRFLSSRKATFCSNSQPGYLTAIAKITDPESGKEQVIAEWTSNDFRRRVDAEKGFRKWMKDNQIKSRMIEEASKKYTKSEKAQ